MHGSKRVPQIKIINKEGIKLAQEIKSEFERWLNAGNTKKYNPDFILHNLLEVSAYSISKSISKIGIFEIKDNSLISS